MCDRIYVTYTVFISLEWCLYHLCGIYITRVVFMRAIQKVIDPFFS